VAALHRARRLVVTAGLFALLLAAGFVVARSEPAIHQRVHELKEWIPLVDDPAQADSAWTGITAYMRVNADSVQRGFGWYLLYCAAQANGRVDSMRVAAESSMVYSPSDPSGFRELAMYLCKAGHHLDLAEEASRRTIETPKQPIRPEQKRSDLRWLGRIQERRGKVPDAIATFERCVTLLDTPDDYALRQLGRLYAGQGQADLAVDRLERGLAAYPIDSTESARLGSLLDSLLTARGDDAAAVQATLARSREAAKQRYWIDDYRLEKSAPRVAFYDSTAKKRVDLAAGKGLTVVYAWATWCAPCRASLPELESWASRPRSKPIRVVTVNAEGEPISQARAKVGRLFLEKHVTLPVAFADSTTAAKWGLAGFPMTLVLEDGRIVYRRHAGGLVEGLDAQLATLGSTPRP
jgi:thiol-disulfide isomerase/thioredoxin